MTPVTVTEPSMAFRSCRHTTKALKEPGWESLRRHKAVKNTHLLEGDHPHQTAHAGHIGVIEAQQREDGVGLWRRAGHGLNTNSYQDVRFWAV